MQSVFAFFLYSQIAENKKAAIFYIYRLGGTYLVSDDWNLPELSMSRNL